MPRLDLGQHSLYLSTLPWRPEPGLTLPAVAVSVLQMKAVDLNILFPSQTALRNGLHPVPRQESISSSAVL